MVLYRCGKCLFATSDKSKYTRHLNRKFPCKIVEEPVWTPPTIEKNISNKIITKHSTEHSETFQIIPKKSISPKTFKCEYCTNNYSSGFNLNKHLKICKTKKKHELYLNSEFHRLKCQLHDEKKRVEELQSLNTTGGERLNTTFSNQEIIDSNIDTFKTFTSQCI